MAAAWTYTGGSRPYGYHGLGEVAVFAFFGVAAVAGTAYVQMDRLTWLALAASVPVGLLSCALLVINNLRDIPSDAAAGKRTLAVLIGDHRTRVLYGGCLLIPFGMLVVIALRPAARAAGPGHAAARAAPAPRGAGRRAGPGPDRCAGADRQAAARVRRCCSPSASRSPSDPAREKRLARRAADGVRVAA